MNIARIILFLFFATLGGQMIAQANLITKKGGKYIFMEKKYKWKYLAPILEESEEALEKYNSGLANRKTSKTMCIVGLAFIAGSLAVSSSGTIEALVLASLGFVSGVVLEILSLIPYGMGTSKIKKSVDIYNFEMIERKGYNSDQSLIFGLTRNGVGLVYGF